MIFQDPYSSLNPRFKVKDIIAEPIKFFQKSITRNDLDQNVNDLIDIVALKIIERSKIKTRVIKSDIKTLEKAIKGGTVGTEILISKK